MKRNVLLILLLLLASNLFAQDSIRALNVFRHYIRNGKVTNDKYVIEQQTFDLKDRVVLRVHYTDSVPKIKTFTRLYYNDQNLISDETFTVANDVVRIKRYAYDKSGNLTEEKIYEPGRQRMMNTLTTEYKYSDGKLASRTILDPRGKWLEKHVMEYDDSTETILIKYQKKNEDRIRNETIICTFRKGKIIRKTSQRVFQDKHEVIRTTTYAYDDKGNLAEKVIMADGKFKKRITYTWYVNGTLNRQSTYDEEDQLSEYLSHSYVQRITTLGEVPMFDLTRPLSP